jgi:hypothetical protein
MKIVLIMKFLVAAEIWLGRGFTSQKILADASSDKYGHNSPTQIDN